MSKEIYQTIEKHGLYIVIPYQIYTRRKVAAQAKLILGEIMALLKVETPFVWAGNAHFGKLFGIKGETASYHINRLMKLGFITRQIFKHGCNDSLCPIQKLENHRHIYPTSALLDISNSLSSRLKEPSQTPSKEELQIEINSNTSETLPNGKSRQVEKANKKESSRCPLLLKEKYPSLAKKYPGGHNECVEFITSIEAEFKSGRKFVSYGKQFGTLHKILRAGYSFEEINSCIVRMEENNFWREKGWDFGDVANVIGKGGTQYGKSG